MAGRPKFTEAESFRLFMEGVRSLQLYDEEADQHESSGECGPLGQDGPPDGDLLNRHLGEAEARLEKCVETYPDDLLPRYYLGIVLGIRGQAFRNLRLELMNPNTKPDDPDSGPDKLFLRAAKMFEEVAKRASADMLAYAQYNQALTLARTGPVRIARQRKSEDV